MMIYHPDKIIWSKASKAWLAKVRFENMVGVVEYAKGCCTLGFKYWWMNKIRFKNWLSFLHEEWDRIWKFTNQKSQNGVSCTYRMFAYHSLQHEVWKNPFQWISDSGTTISANPASLSHNLRPAFSCWHWSCFYHYYHWMSLNIQNHTSLKTLSNMANELLLTSTILKPEFNSVRIENFKI